MGVHQVIYRRTCLRVLDAEAQCMEIIAIPMLRAFLHRDKENVLERGTVGDGGNENRERRQKRGDNG